MQLKLFRKLHGGDWMYINVGTGDVKDSTPCNSKEFKEENYLC